MTNTKQEQLEAFWIEVSHRAKMQLSDINVGSFHQWRSTIGDKEINRLLRLMELLLCSENNQSEITFLIDLINNKLHGEILFDCFNKRSRLILKEGMKGDIYCMPILYVVICYLLDNTKSVTSFDNEQEPTLSINKRFRFNSNSTDLPECQKGEKSISKF